MLTEREILRLASRGGRYQVDTYSWDSGADEKMEYADKAIAIRVARSYVDGLDYDGALVYDIKVHRIVFLHGNFPDGALPRKRRTETS